MSKIANNSSTKKFINYLYDSGYVMYNYDKRSIVKKENYSMDYTLPNELWMYHKPDCPDGSYWYCFHFHVTGEHSVWEPDWVWNYRVDRFRGDLNGARPNKKMIELSKLVDLDEIR